jgi:hypothetical protein
MQEWTPLLIGLFGLLGGGTGVLGFLAQRSNGDRRRAKDERERGDQERDRADKERARNFAHINYENDLREQLELAHIKPKDYPSDLID